MKRIFELLTAKELKELKAYYLQKGVSERNFYNLKKKPLTVDAMQIAYKLFGLIYDFKTDTISREQRTRLISTEEVDRKIDEFLNAPFHS
jgi:hypothetical protein